MNSYELKEYIIQNNKIIDVLNAIGCFKIKSYKKEYRCGSPSHDNSTSISIKKDTLKIKIYGKDEEKIKGDLFTLVMNIKSLTFPQSIKYIHEVLGIKYIGYTFSKKQDQCKVDILRIFKKASKEYIDYTNEELLIFNEDICSEFIKMPYIGWIREGIMPNTQNIFSVGYSSRYNRVVLPQRYWCGSKNQYVGVIGRTLVDNYEIFDIPKYFPLYKFPKSMNIYGLQENYEGIQKAGYLNLAESEKAVLKRHSKLDYTCVALGGHQISIEQAKILIGLDVSIIIQMDKDISLQHIRSLCEIFYGIRNTYYIYDTFGLLGEKESPADKPNKIYNVLWNRKVKYDEYEHDQYLKELK